MREIKFASEDAALQYLADLTGKRVHVGAAQNRRSFIEELKKEVAKEILPRFKKELMEVMTEEEYAKIIKNYEGMITHTDVTPYVTDSKRSYKQYMKHRMYEDVVGAVRRYFWWVSFVNGAYDNNVELVMQDANDIVVDKVKREDDVNLNPDKLEDYMAKTIGDKVISKVKDFGIAEKAVHGIKGETKPATLIEYIKEAFWKIGMTSLKNRLDELEDRGAGKEIERVTKGPYGDKRDKKQVGEMRVLKDKVKAYIQKNKTVTKNEEVNDRLEEIMMKMVDEGKDPLSVEGNAEAFAKLKKEHAVFSSEDEALQHLANVTGKKVKVAKVKLPTTWKEFRALAAGVAKEMNMNPEVVAMLSEHDFEGYEISEINRAWHDYLGESKDMNDEHEKLDYLSSALHDGLVMMHDDLKDQVEGLVTYQSRPGSFTSEFTKAFQKVVGV